MIYKVIKNGTIQDERGLDLVLSIGQRLHADDQLSLLTLVQAEIDGIITADDGIEATNIAFTPTAAKTKPETTSTNLIND